MTLKELSEQYRQSAGALKERIALLDGILKEEKLCEMERLRMRLRLETLRIMYYDTMKTARILEDYYI